MTRRPPPSAALVATADDTLSCRGDWTVVGMADLARRLRQFDWPAAKTLTVRGDELAALDTVGAWLLRRSLHELERQGRQVTLDGFPARYVDLLDRIDTLAEPALTAPPRPIRGVHHVGKTTLEGFEELFGFLSFTGEATLRFLINLLRPWRFRWRAVLADIGSAGVHALGIVGLLSFLMGVVIAYQGAVQLRIYGANIYIADLVGLTMIRELSPLLAAIIVAGRTGSAYTAQIGTMQVTEEVAALRTIGISPLDVLVIPKMMSLCLVLPLLAVFADILGVFGGMVMAKLQLDLGLVPFLDRLSQAVSMRSFLIGICKAPVFALIIALIGCFQGFRVSGSAASVGRHTTMSVVQSIFLVIVADAQFSILFSWLKI